MDTVLYVSAPDHRVKPLGGRINNITLENNFLYGFKFKVRLNLSIYKSYF